MKSVSKNFGKWKLAKDLKLLNLFQFLFVQEPTKNRPRNICETFEPRTQNSAKSSECWRKSLARNDGLNFFELSAFVLIVQKVPPIYVDRI